MNIWWFHCKATILHFGFANSSWYDISWVLFHRFFASHFHSVEISLAECLSNWMLNHEWMSFQRVSSILYLRRFAIYQSITCSNILQSTITLLLYQSVNNQFDFCWFVRHQANAYHISVFMCACVYVRFQNKCLNSIQLFHEHTPSNTYTSKMLKIAFQPITTTTTAYILMQMNSYLVISHLLEDNDIFNHNSW